MRMSSGPQRTALGKPEASTSPTAHLSAGDQRSGGPSGVLAQSNSRTRRAISPSRSPSAARGANADSPGARAAAGAPARVAAAAGTTMGGEADGGFRIGSIRFVQRTQPALVPGTAPRAHTMLKKRLPGPEFNGVGRGAAADAALPRLRGRAGEGAPSRLASSDASRPPPAS